MLGLASRMGPTFRVWQPLCIQNLSGSKSNVTRGGSPPYPNGSQRLKALPAFVPFSLVKCEVGEIKGGGGEMFHCLICVFYILCRLHVVLVSEMK
jgi:hypothetical protein